MLNEKFKSRMKSLLPRGEYESFIDALENHSDVRALRVNTLKIPTDNFIGMTGIDLKRLSYSDEGFIFTDSGIGNTPEHHAGMFYVQDPGAMATLSALDIKEGWQVLDMCAAPGGKSTQAAAKIGDGGFILSNEYVPKRAKIIVSNYERLGIRHGIVTSLDTAELPKMFSGVFDLVIADVPCSGEGMFRKSDEALSEWSEENVAACAKRQYAILKNAPSLVKPGGYLLYSTCTYSLEENEMIIDAFLKENPDFSLCEVRDELKRVTSDGIAFAGAKNESLTLCRRFYPHKAEGEGQFIALLRKDENSDTKEKFFYKDSAARLSRDEEAVVKRFFSENLKDAPTGRVVKVGSNIVIISHGFPVPQRSVFSAGVLLGNIEKGNLFPSHQFFSAYGRLFKRQENLSKDDGRVTAYLRGEEISANDFSDGGWCSVLYCGVTLGGGKMSLGKIKNHYPKGLRIK